MRTWRWTHVAVLVVGGLALGMAITVDDAVRSLLIVLALVAFLAMTNERRFR